MTRSEFAELSWAGRALRVEYRWVGCPGVDRPLIVFLHEGLGSTAMWKDFPMACCETLGARGLVYSRPGYGRSSARIPSERWRPDYLHRQAHEVLPALLRALNVESQPWLLGHSDGASIALLYAARSPQSVAGLILLAPHVFVEEYGLVNIRQAREAYLTTDLKERLARYYDDVDSAFWGWNDIWLDPAFEAWNIEAELAPINCPVLAIQGLDDEYGTLEQIDRITRRVPQAERLELQDCGHRIHRDQPIRVIETMARFVSDRPSIARRRGIS